MSTEMPAPRAAFRLRGEQTTRIETFTDAAFAFALTLLVIAFEPLGSFRELRAALEGIPPFLASAAMLMLFWWGHHEWSRRYGLDDVVTFLLSCVLVCTVLVYVYPLRFMFSLMQSWVCRLAGLELHNPATIEAAGDVNGVFAVYGVGFAVMSGVLALLNAHAWRRRKELQLTPYECWATKSTLGAWLLLGAAGALSALVALLAPPSWFGYPGWVYALLGPGMPLYARWMRRRYSN